ncbi:MAG: hypothetical protein MGG11_02160, partial [Trichodesmium sp. MAG_R03]|nr:hypothetical protein [Trichodesmium sp. MAG_R03]
YINLKLGEKYCSISQLLDIDFMIASEIDLAIELGEKLDTFWGERRQTADANIVVILEPEKVQ